jgi:penicillin-binding protein 1A
VDFDTPIALSLEQIPALSGAIVSQKITNGDLLALVGGYQFGHNDQFNRATQARRQPGSAFKSVVYSAALDNGFTAASMIDDGPFVGDHSTNQDTWRPSNFDGVFYGPILLNTALARSRNLCTIRVAQRLGPQIIIDRAYALGIGGNIPQNLTISLGSHSITPLTLNEAYTAFASNGQRVRPRMVQRIDDSWGRTIVTFAPEKIDAISPQNAFVMASMLKNAITSGTGHRARHLTRPIGGKTGTTNEARDAWFVGFSPFLVTTVYVGHDTPRPMGRNETGSRVAVPIFARYMQEVELLYPDTDFTIPPGVHIVSVDANNGQLAGLMSERVYQLPFIAGTEPTIISGAPRRRGDDDVRSAEEIFQQ